MSRAETELRRRGMRPVNSGMRLRLIALYTYAFSSSSLSSSSLPFVLFVSGSAELVEGPVNLWSAPSVDLKGHLMPWFSPK